MPSDNVTVALVLGDDLIGGDVVLKIGTVPSPPEVTFTPSNWFQPQRIVVQATDIGSASTVEGSLHFKPRSVGDAAYNSDVTTAMAVASSLRLPVRFFENQPSKVVWSHKRRDVSTITGANLYTSLGAEDYYDFVAAAANLNNNNNVRGVSSLGMVSLTSGRAFVFLVWADSGTATIQSMPFDNTVVQQQQLRIIPTALLLPALPKPLTL